MGSDEKYVYQSVHMIMNLGSSSELGMKHKPWQENEKRINKFCFIGKNLDKKQIISDLNSCIFDGKLPEPGEVPTDELRFKIGDNIECLVDDWETGVITKLWSREDYWETGKYAPYEVVLENGDEILIARDSDVFIRNIKNNIIETDDIISNDSLEFTSL